MGEKTALRIGHETKQPSQFQIRLQYEQRSYSPFPVNACPEGFSLGKNGVYILFLQMSEATLTHQIVSDGGKLSGIMVKPKFPV